MIARKCEMLATTGRDLRYRQISKIRHTNFQDLNVSRLVLQLYLPNPLKPDVKSRMKIYLEHRSNYIWGVNDFIVYLGASHVRGLTVDLN